MRRRAVHNKTTLSLPPCPTLPYPTLPWRQDRATEQYGVGWPRWKDDAPVAYTMDGSGFHCDQSSLRGGRPSLLGHWNLHLAGTTALQGGNSTVLAYCSLGTVVSS